MTNILRHRGLAASVFIAGLMVGVVAPRAMDRAGVGPVAAIATAALAENVPVLAGNAVDAADQLGPVDILAAADRLTLRFRGYPELTGDYRVSPDRVVSIPVIGRLTIEGLDLAGLEKVLSSKLASIVQKEAFVTAEIAAYRPVFITGAVRNPGSIEWRPGLTVLQSIALAGGMAADYVPSAVAGSGPNLLAFKKAVDGQKRDLATMARLQAIRQDAAQITVPPELISMVGAGEAEDLIAHETEILMNDRDTVAVKLEALQHGIDAGNAEMSSLRAQIDKLNEQLKIRVDYRNNVKALFVKGVITAERDMEEEIKVTDLEEKITNISVGLGKSAGTIAELQLAAVALKRDRESAVDAELARVERDSAQLAIDIDAARQLPEELPQPASDRVGKTVKSALQIIRQHNGASVTIAADQGTLMRPGDVLVVSRS